MLVRTFEERDVPAACALTNHFIINTAVHFGTTPHSEQDFASMWRSGREKHPWVVAESARGGEGSREAGGGAFAGFAKAGVWRTREAYALTAEVTVYVDPAFHRKGIGRALYAELFRRLRAAGYHAAVGGITLPNEASVGLHRAMGFRHVGTFREVGRKFDRWHDTDWWQLILA